MNHLSTYKNQTDSKAFKEWFGDSKVVDENGDPLIVYHGTIDDFNEFSLDKTGKNTDSGMWGKGFYFTDDVKYAETYTRRGDIKGSIIPTYLAINNPYVIKSKSDIPKIDTPSKTIGDLLNANEIYSILLREKLQSEGYDGVIIYDFNNLVGFKEYVVFESNQIKSATGNNGNFDGNKSNIKENMKHISTYKIFEKSSLNYIGVPEDVMVDIQKQFALSVDAEWKKLEFKKDLRTRLRDKGKLLFITISERDILVIFSINNNYYVDQYKLHSNDDFGDDYWDKEDRIKSTITDVNKLINKSSKIYKLMSGDWTYENRAKRKLDKVSKDFDSFTNQFKEDFAKSFTKIIKKLYSKNASLIQDAIIHNLINQDKNISAEDAKEILLGNISNAKKAKYFKNKGEEVDPYKIQIKYIRDNSLTIFNEYLILFEDKISEKYKEFLTIPELCKKYGRDKILTAFAYYLYAGKIMKL